MKSMSINDIWDLIEIPKGANTVRSSGSPRLNMTPKGISKGLKQDSWQKASRRENESIIPKHSLLCLAKTLSGSLWCLWHIITWNCIL
jgi:hypothetical protein